MTDLYIYTTTKLQVFPCYHVLSERERERERERWCQIRVMYAELPESLCVRVFFRKSLCHGANIALATAVGLCRSVSTAPFAPRSIQQGSRGVMKALRPSRGGNDKQAGSHVRLWWWWRCIDLSNMVV